jgi:hypothetical protein
MLTLVLLLGYCFFASSVQAAEAPPYYSSFGPDGTSTSDFTSTNAVAVDEQNHIAYVLAGNSKLYKFSTSGNPVPFGGSAPYISGNVISGLTPFTCLGCAEVAVDPNSHDVYVTSGNAITAFHADGERANFSAGSGAGTNAIAEFNELLGVAVDKFGNIYASDYIPGGGKVSIFTSSGEKITDFSAPSAASIAVDSQGSVYVNAFADTVFKFSPSDFPVTATTVYSKAPDPLEALPSSAVAVDRTSDDVYVDRFYPYPQIARYDRAGKLLDIFAGPGEEGEVKNSQGVAIDGEEERILVLDDRTNSNPGGPAQVKMFWVSPGPPQITSVSAVDVDANSATLRAGILPRRADTAYHFEYGPDDCAKGSCTSLAAGIIGEGAKTVAVSADLGGLRSGTLYHYRVVAVNEHGDNLPEEGDHIFTTQPASLGFSLADSRAWEMVSPLDKHGGLLDGTRNGLAQAASDGEGVAFSSRGATEADPLGNRAVESTTTIARRTGAGWDARNIGLINSEVAYLPVGYMSEYKVFSPDLSVALVEPRTAASLSPLASERAPVLRNNWTPPIYTPLVTDSDVAPGTKYGGDRASPIGPVNVKAASPDLRHVALTSEVPLLAEGVAGGVYLWSAGELRPVSILPPTEGGVMTNAIVGSDSHSTRHAVSANGSRVFWSTVNSTALYVRDVATQETARLDVQQPGASGDGVSEPIFQGASADGSVVFFIDTQRLTPGASPEGADLYRCELPAGPVTAGCSSLTNVTAGAAGEAGAQVMPLISGINETATSIYFVAAGVLDSSPNRFGENASISKPNLYVWRQDHGIRFIAALSSIDDHAWGGELGNVTDLSAATSPSGRYLAFMSSRSLTGEYNLDAETDEPVQQIYRYDAVADRLDCASCMPTGAAPNGVLGKEEETLVDPRKQWVGISVAAILPQPTVIKLDDASLYSPRVALDSGRVYFNSINPLVPTDSNGAWDVYQYEPVGIGTCGATSQDAATSRSGDDCISLISSGTAEGATAFLDASESGNDVFFLTRGKLNEIDEDDDLDVYDARVNGVPRTHLPLAECLGEACQAPARAPEDASPASATFEGPGNPRARHRKHCGKGKRLVKRKGKARCVSRRHGPSRGTRR